MREYGFSMLSRSSGSARFLHSLLEPMKNMRITRQSNPDTSTDQEPLSRRLRGIRHARFHDPDVVYHVMLRVVQGFFLLRPDKHDHLTRLIGGVIHRAQHLYPSVRYFADAWLSNHAHILLQGEPDEISSFVGFLSREVSRRWGKVVAWPGRMFENYDSTALPTEESQHLALEYVASQSVKEQLVASPLQWPGAHFARDLARSLERRGVWLDGTAYGKARHQRLACRKPSGAAPARTDYEHKVSARFEKLPALAHLSDDAYRRHIASLVRSIAKDNAAHRSRTGGAVLGRRGVLSTPRMRRSPLPPPPWFEKRRRTIYCWAKRTARETKSYLDRYWEFQHRFFQASERFRRGDLTVAFPNGAFRPPSFTATG